MGPMYITTRYNAKMPRFHLITTKQEKGLTPYKGIKIYTLAGSFFRYSKQNMQKLLGFYSFFVCFVPKRKNLMKILILFAIKYWLS